MDIFTFTLSSLSAFGVLLSVGLAVYFPKAQTQTSRFSNIVLSILVLTISMRVIKPDFYLVYTNNYTAVPFLESKNRALVFKISYWLNL